MSIELPDLDDLDYDDLVQQALASIPTLYPGWTNENASDPGITLVELLAWLVDMVIYRTNRIPPQNYQVFLQLLNGPKWKPVPDSELPEAIRRTTAQLRAIYRAVTPADYESLTLGVFPQTGAAGDVAEPIHRVVCLGERDVSGGSPTEDAPGHVSVVVASGVDPRSPWDQPSAGLQDALATFFDDRRLLTTVLHVAGPGFIEVSVGATLYLENDASPPAVLDEARRALVRHFHPWTGGSDGAGWPFGRWVHASEISILLSGIDGVHCVEGVTLSATGPDGDRGRAARAPASIQPPEPTIVAVEIEPHELPKVTDGDVTLAIKVMQGAVGQVGTTWVDWSTA